MDTEPNAPEDIQATEVDEPAKGLLNSDQGDNQSSVSNELGPVHSEGEHDGEQEEHHSAKGKLRGKPTGGTVKGGGSTGGSRPSGPKR